MVVNISYFVPTKKAWAVRFSSRTCLYLSIECSKSLISIIISVFPKIKKKKKNSSGMRLFVLVKRASKKKRLDQGTMATIAYHSLTEFKVLLRLKSNINKTATASLQTRGSIDKNSL